MSRVSVHVAVDIVLLTLENGGLRTLLIQRGSPPFTGCWALPGGFLEADEDLLQAAERELHEETSIPPGSAPLRQIGTWGAPDRDPRGRVLSVVFAALARPSLLSTIAAGTDAVDAAWFALDELPPLAFDHAEMLSAALAHLRANLHTAVPYELVDDTFTVDELRVVHEAILGQPLLAANFRRSFRRLLADGVVVDTGKVRKTRTKPAALYAFSRADSSRSSTERPPDPGP